MIGTLIFLVSLPHVVDRRSSFLVQLLISYFACLNILPFVCRHFSHVRLPSVEPVRMLPQVQDPPKPAGDLVGAPGGGLPQEWQPLPQQPPRH